MKNKAISICDHIISDDIDVIALTETWLGTDVDNAVLQDLVPNGFDVIHNLRVNLKGGGVAIIFRKNIKMTKYHMNKTFTQFEHLECTMSTNGSKLQICVIYRPPPSKVNKLTPSSFFNEWVDYISSHVIDTEELLITGDFNFHLDNANDTSSQKFLSTLSEYGLTQHVKTSTHVSGHILDVVITRDCTNILKIPPKVNDTFICDSKGVSYSDHKGINTV